MNAGRTIRRGHAIAILRRFVAVWNYNQRLKNKCHPKSADRARSPAAVSSSSAAVAPPTANRNLSKLE